MENIDNREFIDDDEWSQMEVISWDGSVQFSEYEDPRASDYLESTNGSNSNMTNDNTEYYDELEEQYWDANVVEEYNYWKMKKWYDNEKEVWDVLKDTSPKNNKQTKMLLEETLLGDCHDLAA